MIEATSSTMRLLLASALVGLGAIAWGAQPEEGTGPAKGAEAFAVPSFRHLDPNAPVPDLRAVKSIRFLTEEDFPPFSYRDASGAMAGFNVGLAEALCRELRLACEFVPTPWHRLIEALERGEGDAILAGLRISPRTIERLDFTRPYYRSLGRFAVRVETVIATADVHALAGKRVGVMAGTSHEAYLKAHFARSDIRPFGDEEAAREALRTGQIDALFDDASRLMFWLASEKSHACCKFAAGAYVDPGTFSTTMAMAVKRGDERLREVLDYGLDRVQRSGAFAAVYRRYFPMSPW